MADLIFPVPGRRSIIGKWYYEQPDGSKGPLGPVITETPRAAPQSPVCAPKGAAKGALAILEKMVAGLSYEELVALRLIIEKNLQQQFVRQAAALSVTE